MKTSYRELDYVYGKAMQQLRNTIGITQAGLANKLGVSWRTVAGWEAGSSYPRAEHLKALIALAVQQQAFSKDCEAEEIRTLWKVAQQKMLLDERWLSALLVQRNSPQEEIAEIIQTSGTRQEIGDNKIEPRSGPVIPNSLNPEPGIDPVPYSDLLPPPIPVLSVEESMSNAVTTRPQRLEAEIIGLSSSIVEIRSAQEPGSVQDKVPVGGTISPIGARPNPRSDKARERRKGLLALVIALALLVIIGSAGTLSFYTRAQASQTATDQTYPGYLFGHGTFVFLDPLNQERGSQWRALSKNQYGDSCLFTRGTYRISDPHTNSFFSCSAHRIFSNFAFEVQLTIIQGDCGGIRFRDDGDEHFYYFAVCQNSRYRVIQFVSRSGSDVKVLQDSSSLAIHTGLSQRNKIAVVADRNALLFYVNEQQIDQVYNSSYDSGTIGLIASPLNSSGHATDVAYSNAKLWTL